jgi:peptidoglycan/xylan/chitin deacetylase (PgdA/CDA1 family)
MLFRRPHVSVALAALLMLAVGSWTGDSFGSTRTAFSKLAAHSGPAPAATAPAAPPSAAPAAPSAPMSDPTATVDPSFAPNTVARHTGSDAVALTFDDGPGDQTLPILALLRAHGVKATFCLVGVRVRARPDLVQAIVRDGHTLCNHSWQHDMRLGQRTPETIRSDLQRTNDEIHQAVPGVPIKYFRHPGGMWTPAAVAIAQDLGMTSIGWDVDPSDWNVARYTPGPIMTDHVIATVQQNARPGSIVLSHDSGGDRTSTLAAYRVLLPHLLEEQHLRLVALPTGEQPPPPPPVVRHHREER